MGVAESTRIMGKKEWAKILRVRGFGIYEMYCNWQVEKNGFPQWLNRPMKPKNKFEF